MCRFKELGKMKETKFDGYNLKPFIIDAVHRLGFMNRQIFKSG